MFPFEREFDDVRNVNRHVPHLSREARLERLLNAASDLVTESGISAVNMTAIAERSGVSRQWLHEFLPDLESVYIALYLQYRPDFIVDEPTEFRNIDDLEKQITTECLALLDLPIAAAFILSNALNNVGFEPHPAPRRSLRGVFLANLDTRYGQPLVDLGYDRNEVNATVLTIVNASLGFVIASRDGQFNREATVKRMVDVVTAVINDTIRAPRQFEHFVD